MNVQMQWYSYKNHCIFMRGCFVLFFLPVNLTCMPTMGRSCRAQGEYAAFEQKDPTQP